MRRIALLATILVALAPLGGVFANAATLDGGESDLLAQVNSFVTLDGGEIGRAEVGLVDRHAAEVTGVKHRAGKQVSAKPGSRGECHAAGGAA